MLALFNGTYLETLILEHPFDGSVLAGGRQLGLKHYSERAVADNLALCVLHISSLTGDTILHLLTDDLCDSEMLAEARRSIAMTLCGSYLPSSNSGTRLACSATY